jgi:pilus assembly protein FimV
MSSARLCAATVRATGQPCTCRALNGTAFCGKHVASSTASAAAIARDAPPAAGAVPVAVPGAQSGAADARGQAVTSAAQKKTTKKKAAPPMAAAPNVAPAPAAQRPPPPLPAETPAAPPAPPAAACAPQSPGCAPVPGQVCLALFDALHARLVVL